MKFNAKKFISLAFVLIFAFSCFSINAFAAEPQAAEAGNFFQEAICFLIGEDAFVDGNFNFEAILHLIYYKDSPLLRTFYDAVYVAFWDMLISIINLFV